MIENAKEARERAAIVKGANQLVNETAAVPLIAAAEQGETSAAVATPRFDLIPASGMMGHIYDNALAVALEAAGQHATALGIRKLVALGFHVASTIREEERMVDGRTDKPAISIEGLRLSFANAEELDATRLSVPVLLGVVLPPAHHWRRRATQMQLVRQIEKRVLAQVAQEVERGATRCRLDARKLHDAGLPGEVGERLIAALRTRGFDADIVANGSQLNVRWEA